MWNTSVCANPNCTHADESCPSYIATPSAMFPPMLLRVGDQLLVVFTETTDSSNPHGMLMNMDGSNRRTVFELASNQYMQGGFCTSGNDLYYKNLSIDENDYSVQRQGCRIHLTTTEYQLFITLLDHSGHICSRNFLLASAWNITVPIQTRTIDVHIAKLRKKLDLGPDDLKTVMGRGYALSG